jgi:hypothetical protein
MENINSMGHVFRHPKYYEELRKKRKQDILPRGNMSPGLEEKPQASSDKRQAATIDHLNKKEKNE